MKLITLALVIFTTTAHARVDARFLAFIGMVAINDRVMGQITDDDPQRLHAAMNVEEKESGGRRAKTIRLADKKFTLLCGNQGPDAMVCTMVVKQGPQGTVDAKRGVIRFVALGDEARDLHKLFHAGSDGLFEYFSADQTLRLRSDGQSFIAEFVRP